MIQYEKTVGEFAVQFETMLGALRCRQTDAEWSYRYLREHSVRESLEVAPELDAHIPEPELLFAMKLHSGRTADVRDLVIVSERVDFDRICDHLHRGEETALRKQITGVIETIDGETFEDSLKGVFQQSHFPETTVNELLAFLRDQLTEQW